MEDTIQWYRNRPLPPLPDRKWSEFNFPIFGLRAKLVTQWDEPANKLHYKLALMPSEGADPNEFFTRFALAQHDFGEPHVTLNLYNKRRFVVQSSEEYLILFTSIMDNDRKARSRSGKASFTSQGNSMPSFRVGI